MTENPRWFNRVFWAVGLMGEGETGRRGDLMAWEVVVAVGSASASLGLPVRASILTPWRRHVDFSFGKNVE